MSQHSEYYQAFQLDEICLLLHSELETLAFVQVSRQEINTTIESFLKVNAASGGAIDFRHLATSRRYEKS